MDHLGSESPRVMFYGTGNASNKNSRPVCLKRPEYWYTDVKPSVTHLLTLRCKVWVRVPDEKKKALETKSKTWRLTSFVTFCAISSFLEEIHNVTTSSQLSVGKTNYRWKGAQMSSGWPITNLGRFFIATMRLPSSWRSNKQQRHIQR